MKSLFRFKTKFEYIECVGNDYMHFGPGWDQRLNVLFGTIIPEEYNEGCLKLALGFYDSCWLPLNINSLNIFVCKEMILPILENECSN